MKKFAVLILILFVTIVPCFCDDYSDFIDDDDKNAIFNAVPNDAKPFLEEYGIKDLSHEKLLNLSVTDFFKGIFSSVKGSLKTPLSVLTIIIGSILVSAIINALSPKGEHFFTVVSILMATALITPIAKIIKSTVDAILQLSDFMLSFVPIYTGIITALGKPITAISYQTNIMIATQVVFTIAANVLTPMLSIYLAFCLIGSASSEIKIDSISKGISSIVTSSLSFILMVFVSLLTIQGNIASSADKVSVKTAKFALSAFLPVVGPAVSDAFESVQGSLSLLKATVGGFFIFVLISTFLKSVIDILLFKFVLIISGSVAEILGTDKISSLAKGANGVLTVLLGITIVFFMLFCISTGIMVSLTSK